MNWVVKGSKRSELSSVVYQKFSWKLSYYITVTDYGMFGWAFLEHVELIMDV